MVQQQSNPQTLIDGNDDPRRFVFLLLDNFTMIAFAGAIEPLRIANLMKRGKVYDWTIVSEDGNAVRCSNGALVNVDSELMPVGRDDTVVVCSGIHVREASRKPVLSWLRREAKKGIRIVGICTAAYTLAKAELLHNRTATIHWENRDGLVEEFPELDVSKSVFKIDGNRITTSGGVSTIDLMLRLISDDFGTKFSNDIADQLIYNTIRTDADEQRLSVPSRLGIRHPKLAQVIQMMEENIEEPISPTVLAKEKGMSSRQLERLFRRYLNRTPKRYYMELRLQKARNLLMQTDMAVIDVAVACGFGSPSHFSKCYRSTYNTTPYRERGSHAGRGSSTPSGTIR